MRTGDRWATRSRVSAAAELLDRIGASMNAHTTSITAKAIVPRFCAALVLSALILLGGLRGAQAGVDGWTTSGPEGGTVQALAIDPQNPATLYAAVRHNASPESTDVYKSADAGSSWRVVANLSGSPQALAIDPQTPTTLYLRAYRRVYKSTDGGDRWTLVNTSLPGSYLSVQNLVIDPQTPTTLYAGTFGDGVFKSTDGGGTWNAVNTGLPTPYSPGSYPSVDALAIDPQTPTTLYLGLGDGSGVYKSTNGGGSWSPASTGLGEGPIYSLAIDPQTPTTLYAAVGYGGIFKSTDGGGTWHAASAGLPTWGGSNYRIVSSLAIDPRTPTTLYAATGAGVFKSVNGGGDWSAVNSPAVVLLVIDPQTPTTLYGGAEFRGIVKSTDAGAGWRAVNTGLTNSLVVGLAIDPQTPTTLYASAYGQGLFRSTDGGGSWVKIAETVGVLAIDPQTPTTLYAGMSGPTYGVVMKSTDGGNTWSSHRVGQFPSNVFDVNRIRELAIDPLTPTTLYAIPTGRGAFKSTDGGQTWSEILPSSNGVSSGVTLAVDPQTPTTLYAGRSTGTTTSEILKSTDGGATWSVINNDIGVGIFAIDPQTTSTLYVSGVDNRTGSRGVFKSTDGGVSWSAINNGLTNFLVMAFAIDPQTPTTLYVGGFDSTTRIGGVFKSTDGGQSWSALNAGLTTSQVWHLAIDPQTPTTLYAGTSMGVFTIQQTKVSIATTVNFDTPPPPGHMNGVFEGIDFGVGQWQWTGPYNVDPTNHIYFADSTGTSRSFQFAPGPRVLNGLRVYTPTPGTLTLSDDVGQTFAQAVTTGSLQAVATGWTRPAHHGDRELHRGVGFGDRRHHVRHGAVVPDGRGRSRTLN
jgi:photosystem II stability/assembly factor-like uncharacterized protein